MTFIAFVKHFEIYGQEARVRVVLSSEREVILIFLCLFLPRDFFSVRKKLLIAN